MPKRKILCSSSLVLPMIWFLIYFFLLIFRLFFITIIIILFIFFYAKFCKLLVQFIYTQVITVLFFSKRLPYKRMGDLLLEWKFLNLKRPEFQVIKRRWNKNHSWIIFFSFIMQAWLKSLLCAISLIDLIDVSQARI